MRLWEQRLFLTAAPQRRVATRMICLCALYALTGATAARAQLLHVDVPIIGVAHNYKPGLPFVFDSLLMGPTVPSPIDLAGYTEFAVHYSAPGGQEIVVARDSRGIFSGSLFHTSQTPNATTGNIVITFDGLAGSLPVFVSNAVRAGGNAGFVAIQTDHVTAPFSFTGFTVTTSNLGTPPVSTGPDTYDVLASDFLETIASDAPDPGQFVFLRPLAVPEPGPTAFVMGIGASFGVLAIRRQLRRGAALRKI